jgi:putative transposase
MARNIEISEGEYYHIYNRGVLKNIIFIDQRDYTRFLLLLLLFQSDTPIYNISDAVTSFLKRRELNISPKKRKEIGDNKIAELICFTMMPNHFHLIVGESREGGISRYMHKVLMAYSKYFNAKYKRSGHVFQGAYKIVHIEDNDQLLYTSAYVHKNQKELLDWKNRPEKYSWSSYQDYAIENRWGDLLSRDIVLSQFKNQEEYLNWVKDTVAKEDDDDFPKD